MAKITYVKSRRRKGGGKGFRRIHASVDLSLDNRPGGAVFVACASVGMGPRGKMQVQAIRRNNARVALACVSSKNPRRAAGLALQAAGKKIMERSGAFAGLK